MADPRTIELPNRIAGRVRSSTPSSGYDRGFSLPRDDRYTPNESVQAIRGANKASQLMREWFEADGTISTAIVQYVSMADTPLRFDVFRTGTNEYSEEGLRAVETIVSGIDTLWNYRRGYQDKPSLSQTKQTLLLEVALTGAAGLELVLDSYRMPQYLAVVPYETLEWRSDGRSGKYPVQRSISTGEIIDLNIPNLFISEMYKQSDRLYTLPVMISGLKRLIAYESFIEDMTRVMRQSGQPRVLVKLDYEKVRASAPADISSDPKKLSAYLSSVRSDMEVLLRDLNPEDALVFYDLAEVEAVQTAGEKKDYSDLLQELSGLSASALKSNPSALGLRVAGGSQNVASTEAMLSTKMAASLQQPAASVLSRALTMAVRMYGLDVYVKVKFEDINLRPKDELEAHATMKQQRVLELLSLGRITDAEAQSMLGLPSLPENAQRLEGTLFRETKQLDTLPASGTNARNASIMPGTPAAAGGRDNQQRV